MGFFIKTTDGEQGPYSRAEIADFLAGGQLRPDQRIRSEEAGIVTVGTAVEEPAGAVAPPVEDDPLARDPRPTPRRRQPARAARRTRSSGAGGGGSGKALGIGVVVAIVIGLKVLAFSGGFSSWRVADQGSERIGPEEAWVAEYQCRKSVDFRVTATESEGKPLKVFWLTRRDHQRLQQNGLDPALDRAIQRQALQLNGSLDTPRTVTLPQGTNFIYFQGGDEVYEPVVIKYKIEAYD